MSYTFTEHTANGTQTTFPFRFAGRDKGYLRASDILVEVRNDGVWNTVSGWTLTGTNQITFNVPPAANTKLRIRRVVEKEEPYAEFDRGVTLDMKSLNNSFIHLLEVSQELLDGFYPDGYFVKQEVSWGGHKITDLADGTNPGDAVNKGQLDSIDKKHTDWNAKQDIEIAGLKAGMTSGIAHRTVPWYTIAQGGEISVKPPYEFQDALVFLNGVLQHQIVGAYSISNNTITFAEPLVAGTEVYVLVGSRVATSEPNIQLELNFDLVEGQQVVKIGSAFKYIEVYLDGLLQPKLTYRVDGDTVTFSEGVPECRMTAKIITE
ncbi:tail fiber protein [Escherichia phage LL11]|uniref:Tail fiber protein n=1 Tax=Escherichia phage LL11 TaxID=2315628 RepID=A0A385IQD3_9CAUD|nr:tail fiber protein [Escherichia phage LL11]AXY85412.1 tail fiber protein [Escherichia phage LL11]